MNNKFLILILFSCFLISGCGDMPANTTNATKANGSNATTVNTSVPLNTSVPTNAATPANVIATNGTSASNTSKDANKASSNSQPTPKPEGSPKTNPTPEQKTEKKDEGLFSFPPPKVTSYAQLDAKKLLNPDGQTTFSQVSQKLAAALEKSGYNPSKGYRFFWNEADEFAIVTTMERINSDGKAFEGSERWDNSVALPKAKSGEYFKDLIYGKKVYYRVFAFVVTAKRTGQSFFRNSPPEFEMAKSWSEMGEDEFGVGESTAIKEVVFDEKYKCFVLLYLFVNHTSLEKPKFIDSRKDDILKQGLELDALNHLRMAGINVGGEQK